MLHYDSRNLPTVIGGIWYTFERSTPRGRLESLSTYTIFTKRKSTAHTTGGTIVQCGGLHNYVLWQNVHWS